MNDLTEKRAAINAPNGKKTATGRSFEEVAIDDTKHFTSRIVSIPQLISCDGCRHISKYNTDLPCSKCLRRVIDYYEPVERFDERR